MFEIIRFFFIIIGIFATITFIDKILTGRKMSKLADQTARRLREERRHEQLVAEWSNMTSANTPAIFNHVTGYWMARSEMRSAEEPT